MVQFKTPDEVALQYRTHLKNLKPEVDVRRTDSDWYIRSQVNGGLISGVYADQIKISNDAFPQSARREALRKHLELYFDRDFNVPQQSRGFISATGDTTSVVSIGRQLVYQPNGNLYTVTENVAFDGATAVDIPIISVEGGSDKNLIPGAELVFQSPDAGVEAIAVVTGSGLLDGTDEETNEQAAAAILRQERTPLAGGKVADYEQFATDADPSVTSVSVLRFLFGFGTVGVVITAGTTNIDSAINNGQDVFLIPSAELIEQVQEYIESQAPHLDCPYVLAPASTPVDVTVKVRFADGDKDTAITVFDQELTQGELVEREVKRALFKTPPGGRKFGSDGYVLASEIEETIDFNLSAAPIAVGNIAQIVVDRQVQDLSASGPNLPISANEVAFPGTITIVEF